MTRTWPTWAFALCLLSTALISPVAQEAQTNSANPEAPAETHPDELVLATPALITTVGRADGTIVSVLCRRAGIDAELVEEAKEENLAGIATVIVSMGGSTMGLVAAGVNADSEVERGEAVLALATEANVPILGVHVGGASRRGELSDDFCELVAEAADALIVKSGGNEDGLLTAIAERREIPLIEVGTNAEAIDALAALFGVAEVQ
jgi:Domain of unknown function (DUF6305)